MASSAKALAFVAAASEATGRWLVELHLDKHFLHGHQQLACMKLGVKNMV